MTKAPWYALLAALCVGAGSPVWTDAFDNYTNAVLAQVPQAAGAMPITELTTEMITKNDAVLPGIKGALVVIYTNDKRWSKLLIVAAKQKVTPANGGEAF